MRLSSISWDQPQDILLLATASAQEDTSDHTSTFQAPVSILSITIVLANALPMAKPQDNGQRNIPVEYSPQSEGGRGCIFLKNNLLLFLPQCFLWIKIQNQCLISLSFCFLIVLHCQVLLSHLSLFIMRTDFLKRQSYKMNSRALSYLFLYWPSL